MGSRFQFEIMTAEHARDLLSWKINQAEFFGDKIRAQHRLRPVVSPGEVAQNKHYLATGEVLPLAHFIALEQSTPAPSPKAEQVEQMRERIKPSGPWFTVPAMTRPFRCRSCNADGYWITTNAGERMLVDCDVRGGTRPNNADDGKGVAHWATCPTADQHRSPR